MVLHFGHFDRFDRFDRFGRFGRFDRFGDGPYSDFDVYHWMSPGFRDPNSHWLLLNSNNQGSRNNYLNVFIDLGYKVK